MTTDHAEDLDRRLTEVPSATARVSLVKLASVGADELRARLRRALPGETPGQVAVAAFHSSI